MNKVHFRKKKTIKKIKTFKMHKKSKKLKNVKKSKKLKNVNKKKRLSLYGRGLIRTNKTTPNQNVIVRGVRKPFEPVTLVKRRPPTLQEHQEALEKLREQRERLRLRIQQQLQQGQLQNQQIQNRGVLPTVDPYSDDQNENFKPPNL